MNWETQIPACLITVLFRHSSISNLKVIITPQLFCYLTHLDLVSNFGDDIDSGIKRGIIFLPGSINPENLYISHCNFCPFMFYCRAHRLTSWNCSSAHSRTRSNAELNHGFAIPVTVWSFISSIFVSCFNWLCISRSRNTEVQCRMSRSLIPFFITIADSIYFSW